jgi:hypothetical protein
MAPAEFKDVVTMFGLKNYTVKTTYPATQQRLGEHEETEYHRERALPHKMIVMPRCNSKEKFP